MFAAPVDQARVRRGTDVVLLVWGAALIVAALVRRRWVVAAQALAALVLAFLVCGIATELAVGDWPDSRFPTLWVGEAAAVMVTISPHLVQPLRTLGRRVLALGVVGAAVTAGGTPGGVVAALAIAVVVASGLRLAWGTSAGRPGLDSVGIAGLARPRRSASSRRPSTRRS